MMPRPPGTKETREKKSPTPKPTITRPGGSGWRHGAEGRPQDAARQHPVERDPRRRRDHAATCARAGTRCPRSRLCWKRQNRTRPGVRLGAKRRSRRCASLPIAEQRQPPQPAVRDQDERVERARRRRWPARPTRRSAPSPESCWRMTSETKPPRMKKSSVKLVRKVWTSEISTARPGRQRRTATGGTCGPRSRKGPRW